MRIAQHRALPWMPKRRFRTLEDLKLQKDLVSMSSDHRHLLTQTVSYSKNSLTLSIQLLLCGLCLAPPSVVS
jgi:hypothetical protein